MNVPFNMGIASFLMSLFESLITKIRASAAAKAAGKLTQGEAQSKAIATDLETIESELKRGLSPTGH